jgi:hypothetical protein
MVTAAACRARCRAACPAELPAEAAPRDAGGQDHRPGRDLVAVGQPQDPLAAYVVQAGDGLVDGGGEPGRPGPDDGDVALAEVGPGAAADRLDEPGRRGLHHRVAVVPDHDRQPALLQAPALEEGTARPAGRGHEAERHVEPDEQFAQLVRGAAGEVADDGEQVEAGFLVLGPVGQELADLAVQVRSATGSPCSARRRSAASPAAADDSPTTRKSRLNRRLRSERSARTTPASSSSTSRTGLDIGYRAATAAGSMFWLIWKALSGS